MITNEESNKLFQEFFETEILPHLKAEPSTIQNLVYESARMGWHKAMMACLLDSVGGLIAKSVIDRAKE